MINPQLLDYVRAQRSAGLTKEAIAAALAAGGWTANDVNEAFMALDGVKTPPPPPPQAPPPLTSAPSPIGAMAPRVIVPPPGAPPLQSQPIGGPGVVSPIPAPRPRLAPSEFSTAPTRHKRSSWSFILLFFLLLLVIGGGAMIYINPSVLDSFAPYFKSFFPEVVPIDEEPATTVPPAPTSTTTVLPGISETATTSTTSTATTSTSTLVH